MIKISVAQLEHGPLRLEGSEAPEFIALPENDMISCRDRVVYRIKATLINGGVLVEGEVSTTLKAVCGKCLGEFTHKAENGKLCHFYEKVSVSELDISDDIREDILISFPQNYQCSENCRGLCHVCGCNLNTETCTCSPREPEDDLWSELNKLNIEKD